MCFPFQTPMLKWTSITLVFSLNSLRSRIFFLQVLFTRILLFLCGCLFFHSKVEELPKNRNNISRGKYSRWRPKLETCSSWYARNIFWCLYSPTGLQTVHFVLQMRGSSLVGHGDRAAWWMKCHFFTQSSSAPQPSGLLLSQEILCHPKSIPRDLSQWLFSTQVLTLCAEQWYTKQNTGWTFKCFYNSNVTITIC